MPRRTRLQELTAIGQSVEIPVHGHCRHTQFRYQFLDGQALARTEQIEDAALAHGWCKRHVTTR